MTEIRQGLQLDLSVFSLPVANSRFSEFEEQDKQVCCAAPKSSFFPLNLFQVKGFFRAVWNVSSCEFGKAGCRGVISGPASAHHVSGAHVVHQQEEWLPTESLNRRLRDVRLSYAGKLICNPDNILVSGERWWHCFSMSSSYLSG